MDRKGHIDAVNLAKQAQKGHAEVFETSFERVGARQQIQRPGGCAICWDGVAGGVRTRSRCRTLWSGFFGRSRSLRPASTPKKRRCLPRNILAAIGALATLRPNKPTSELAQWPLGFFYFTNIRAFNPSLSRHPRGVVSASFVSLLLSVSGDAHWGSGTQRRRSSVFFQGATSCNFLF